MTDRFLTPDSLPNQGEPYIITVHPDLLPYVRGALAELTWPDNWEQHGATTPADAANYFTGVTYGIERMTTVKHVLLREGTDATAAIDTWTDCIWDGPGFLDADQISLVIDASFNTVGFKSEVSGKFLVTFAVMMRGENVDDEAVAWIGTDQNGGMLSLRTTKLVGDWPSLAGSVVWDAQTGDILRVKFKQLSSAVTTFGPNCRIEAIRLMG